MQHTTNYRFELPELSDILQPNSFNSNWSTLDSMLLELNNRLNPLSVQNGGTGLRNSPSMLVNLSSIDAASVFQSNPRPGVTGTLPVGRGGTGVNTAPLLLTNLGSTESAAIFQTSPRPGVTGILPVANGGTGAKTAADAWSKLGGGALGKKNNLVASDIPNLPASKIASGRIDGSRIPVIFKAVHVTTQVVDVPAGGTARGEQPLVFPEGYQYFGIQNWRTNHQSACCVQSLYISENKLVAYFRNFSNSVQSTYATAYVMFILDTVL